MIAEDVVVLSVEEQKCYCNYLGNGRWKLTKRSLVVARGHACHSMYKTHVKTRIRKWVISATRCVVEEKNAKRIAA
uniref:Uncharacterized protein n=1 Tax=Quercus lobata TaxID=97700 RepID=A0A7N2KRF5_QUELO